MGRYILRYTGSGRRPAADLRRIRATPKLTVLDEAARMLLVEARAQPLRQVVSSLPGWVCSPERSIRLPDNRPAPRRAPKG